MKRVLTPQIKQQIIKEALKSKQVNGIVCSFDPELDEVDLDDLNKSLVDFGLEAEYNQLYNKKTKKLYKDKHNVFVYKTEEQEEERPKRVAKSRSKK